MAGIVVNVYLVDLFEAVKVANVPKEIENEVAALYTDAFNYANKGKKEEDKHSFVIKWTKTKPTLLDTDVLVYFLPYDFWSIARYMKINEKKSILTAEEWGRTEFRDKETPPMACCEVYVKAVEAKPLANLVFHEMLHGKLIRDNKMHTDQGLAAAEVGKAVMNEANRKAVASTITKAVRFYTDAWKLMEYAAELKKKDDLSWNWT